MTQKKQQDKKKANQIKAQDLVIVPKDQLGALDNNPIDGIDESVYARIEKLTSWFVLRAPLSEVTRLANPGCIDVFKSDKEPAKGSRTRNKMDFEEGFINPLELDCTMFEFAYKRLSVKSMLDACDLRTNGEEVFGSLIERCVCFVGKNGSKEESCIESICRHVRNAFAHGRIAVKVIEGEPFIFAEDGAPPRDIDYGGKKPGGEKLEIRFRMLLKVATLEEWRKILYFDSDTNSNVALSI